MPTRSRRSGSWLTLTPTRVITLLFLVQVAAVLYFLATPSPRAAPPTSHHHGARNPNDYSTTHSFIIVGILSDRAASERRDAVRETWLRLYKGGYGKHHILHKFVIGKPYCLVQNFECDKQTLQLESDLADEAEAYRDILRVDVLDSYNTLSEKVCALIEWAAQHSFDYFLKTDHDIFIRLDTIVSELSAIGPTENYWRGFGWHGVPPISDPSDKNREVVYELGKFPPYTAGALHILSSNLIRSLSSGIPRRYYQNEDQSLGIWLLPFNVLPIHDKRIQQWDVCDSTMIAKHNLSPEKMRVMHSNVVNNRDMCDGFSTKRCPLCYECLPDQDHWIHSGLTCDENGASVGPSLAERNRPYVPALTDQIMGGVVGYLPFISCERTHLEGPQPKTNFVENGHLDGEKLDGWTMHGGVTVVEGGMVDYAGDPSNTCIELTQSTQSKKSFISQIITLNQKVPEPIVLSAWSKADRVDETQNAEDYSLFANIIYKEGGNFQAFAVHFVPGSHEWQHNMRVFNPEHPILKVEIFCLFRFHFGTVWFDNISVTKLSDSLCDLKFKTQYFRGYMPADLIAPPKPLNPSDPKFIVIWTTTESTFLLRHRRVIESIFYHHPGAHVKMYSNTLPDYFFYKFNAAGYNIEIIRYDVKSLGVGLPGETWASRIDEWQKGESFFAHLSDYVRFVLLFREGGVYTDMDSILVRPIDQSNVIGVEYCDEEKLDYCIYLNQYSNTQRFYLPIGFLALEPSHPLIFGALSYFDSRYDPNLWPCGTIYLTLAYTRLTQARAQEDSATTQQKEIVRILPREAFYPISWQKVKQYFTQNSPLLLASIRLHSYAFHIWGQMTLGVIPQEDSLVWQILNSYIISDSKTIYGQF